MKHFQSIKTLPHIIGLGTTQENNHISQAATLGAGGLYYNVHEIYTSYYAAMQKAPCSV